MALAAGMAFVILDAVFHWLAQPNPLAGTAGSWHWGSCSRATRLISQLCKGFPLAKYKIGEVPALYEFFQSSLEHSDRVFGGRSK